MNLTSKAIIYRLKNLEKQKLILGYKPKLNLDKFSYSMYKVDLKINDKKAIKNIKSYIFQLPNVIHTQEVFGGSNLEFDLECQTYDDFQKIIRVIKEKYGSKIEQVMHYRTTKIHKTTYFPDI